MTTYIDMPDKEARKRFHDECKKRGYDYVPEWPSTRPDGSWDPGFPDGMSEAERNEVLRVANGLPNVQKAEDQHPEFKYLRVKR